MSRKMKDSGVAWIGEIPQEWIIARGKYLLELLQRTVSENARIVTCFRDGKVTLRANRREDGFTIALKEIGYQGIEVGDLAVHGMDGFAGAIGISDSQGKCSPVINVLDSSENKRYVMYYLRNMACGNVFAALSTGIRQRSCDISWNKLSGLRYPVPTLYEQNIIVNYLDAKCAEIDKVVEKTRESIEEYKKLKQAVITEAVTKGVRGPRPMKPSGVEWIGDIPEEWELSRLKDIVSFEKGKNAAMYTKEYVGTHAGMYPVYSGQTENGGVMGMIDSFDYDVEECLFTTTVGAKTMTPRILKGKFSLSQNCLIMKKQRECCLPYLFYLLHVVFAYQKALIPTYMQPSLRIEDLRKYILLSPNLPEQQEITGYLDAKCGEIDRLISKKEQLITELETYKKSLIYEYVTGKKEVPA